MGLQTERNGREGVAKVTVSWEGQGCQRRVQLTSGGSISNLGDAMCLVERALAGHAKDSECEPLRNCGKILTRKENDDIYTRETPYSRRRLRVG